MSGIAIVGILFLVSLVVNAIIARWSANKVLGVKISLLRSGLAVGGRSLAALLGGFAVGYAIKVGAQGDAPHKMIQIVGMLCVTGLSFLAYWVLLGKITNTSISLWGMTKTVATETLLLIVSAFGIALLLSAIFYLFGAG